MHVLSISCSIVVEVCCWMPYVASIAMLGRAHNYMTYPTEHPAFLFYMPASAAQ